jgi:hypothetical protein
MQLLIKQYSSLSVTSSLLSPNIIFITCSQTLSIYVFHGKSMVVYFTTLCQQLDFTALTIGWQVNDEAGITHSM